MLQLHVFIAQGKVPQEFQTTAMKENAEGFFPQVVEAKTRVTKDQEINGVVQNVEIHVLLWNVSCGLLIYLVQDFIFSLNHMTKLLSHSQEEYLHTET